MLLLPSLEDADAALLRSHELLARLTRPFELDGRQIQLGASIGLVLAPQQGGDAATLMRCAGVAFDHARRQGSQRVALYADAMGERAQEQLRTREALRHAAQRGELELHYQPQRDLRTGRITVVEALLRWRREPGVLTPPADFIPIAEDCGLIVPIGAWVLQQACRQAVRWPDLVVAVNVSAVQLHSGQLEQQVREALADSGLAPQRLELELTESVLLERVHDALPTLERLRRLGVLLSIDDFGTGYSSLAYLQRLSVDRLKIDRAFVAPLAGARDADQALVGAIVTMARQLGLHTVAEGVESEALCPALAALGCEAVQGYASARPMGAAQLDLWLQERRAQPVGEARTALAPIAV
jgi:EAL domain-containing protein (putative c-di-GMP-specific phosphodiesterase class I)